MMNFYDIKPFTMDTKRDHKKTMIPGKKSLETIYNRIKIMLY